MVVRSQHVSTPDRAGGDILVDDSAIPQLNRLIRAHLATTLLEPVLRAGSRFLGGVHPPLYILDVTLLRGHPGSRWTLRYTVSSRKDGDAVSTFIAKVYARDRSDIARLLIALRECGLGCGRPMQVNAPIAYLTAHRVLLLEYAPGETARAALLRGQGEIGDKVARWLAALHAARVPLPGAYRLEDPYARAHRWAQVMDSDAPTVLARSSRRLFAALTKAQPPWPPPAPCIVHGDFGASHVYLSPDVITVIDWDPWRIGNGAQDAGRFVASLHRIAARHPEQRAAVEREIREFIQTYKVADPTKGHGLAFYTALDCLRRAARCVKEGSERRMGHAELLIAAAERALEAS